MNFDKLYFRGFDLNSALDAFENKAKGCKKCLGKGVIKMMSGSWQKCQCQHPSDSTKRGRHSNIQKKRKKGK